MQLNLQVGAVHCGGVHASLSGSQGRKQPLHNTSAAAFWATSSPVHALLFCNTRVGTSCVLLKAQQALQLLILGGVSVSACCFLSRIICPVALREPLLQFMHTVMALVSLIFFAVAGFVFISWLRSIAERIAWTQSWDKFIFIKEGGIF